MANISSNQTAFNPMAFMPQLSADATTALSGGLKGATAANRAAKANGEDFESMFLNSMFQHMFEGVGKGPFSGGQGASVWRSFLTDEYSKSFVKAGGIGLAKEVERALLAQQEIK
jgi:Rod binding domain-containing protein